MEFYLPFIPEDGLSKPSQEFPVITVLMLPELSVVTYSAAVRYRLQKKWLLGF
jgi:hypothetical protein